jgi:hypothetical protein
MGVRSAEIRWLTARDELLEALTGGKPRLSIVVEHRRCVRRIKNARFPVLKSLDDFKWSWPKKGQPPANPEPVPSARPHGRRAQGLSRLAASFAATRRAWP